ncbi:auxin-responsive protein SAUR21-like [Fagus crenata]
MAIQVPAIMQVKQILRRSVLSGKEAAFTAKKVPKGFFAVYVGEEQKKRFILPISYLNEPSFQKLLSKVEEEFGFNHPMGGLTIPYREDAKQKQMWMAQGERGQRCIKRRLGVLETLKGGASWFQLPTSSDGWFSHRTPCREAFNDQLVWIAHDTNERHDTV